MPEPGSYCSRARARTTESVTTLWGRKTRGRALAGRTEVLPSLRVLPYFPHFRTSLPYVTAYFPHFAYSHFVCTPIRALRASF